MERDNPIQNILIYQRQRAHLDGIAEVESFTESEIVALSSLGRIVIEGEELRIDNFSTESGSLDIHGTIQGVWYAEKEEKKKFWRW